MSEGTLNGQQSEPSTEQASSLAISNILPIGDKTDGTSVSMKKSIG